MEIFDLEQFLQSRGLSLKLEPLFFPSGLSWVASFLFTQGSGAVNGFGRTLAEALHAGVANVKEAGL